MKQRIPIDWDDLEMALTMNMEESDCYLNLRTGKVEISADSSLVGDVGPAEEGIETGVTEGYLIYIEPIESSVEYRWMAEFAESVDDPQRAESSRWLLTAAALSADSKTFLLMNALSASAGLRFTTGVCARQWRNGSPTTTSNRRPRRQSDRTSPIIAGLFSTLAPGRRDRL
jgi:hypothetical protein